jgi:hypothetical protein
MRIESTKGRIEVETIEAAAAWLVEMQPSHAAIDGVDIDAPEGQWTIDAATVAIADQTTLLCDASPEQMARFESAAHDAGHASGKSAANDHSLWGDTVAEAIAAVSDEE